LSIIIGQKADSGYAIKGGLMNRMLAITLLFFLIFLNFSCSPKEKSAISIGDIRITAQEFQKASDRFAYQRTLTKEARKEFLEVFINRKLILREAENEGLDKDPQFLESVQAFWAQSLLKLILDKKIEELSLDISITEDGIESFYKANKDKFPDIEEAEAYDQIKMLIFKEKQRKVLDDWIDFLRKKTNIKIDYKLLDLE